MIRQQWLYYLQQHYIYTSKQYENSNILDVYYSVSLLVKSWLTFKILKVIVWNDAKRSISPFSDWI